MKKMRHLTMTQIQLNKNKLKNKIKLINLHYYNLGLLNFSNNYLSFNRSYNLYCQVVIMKKIKTKCQISQKILANYIYNKSQKPKIASKTFKLANQVRQISQIDSINKIRDIKMEMAGKDLEIILLITNPIMRILIKIMDINIISSIQVTPKTNSIKDLTILIIRKISTITNLMIIF